MYAILRNDTSTNTQKKRVPYIDIAKGIAIISIILSHLNNSQIIRVVFTFHVPIFYFITGYFINNNLQIKEFVKKKARTLLVPYACTCLVIILLYILKSEILEGSVSRQGVITWIYAAIYGAGDSYSHPFYIKAIGAIWFLWAAFWGEIFLYRLLSVNKEMRIAIVVLLFIAGYYSRRLFWFPLSIQAGCCATMFMYIGYLIRGAKETLKELSLETKLVCTLAALLVWLAFIRDFKSFWLVHCDIGRGVLTL